MSTSDTDQTEPATAEARVVNKFKQLKSGGFAHYVRYAFDVDRKQYEGEVEVSPEGYNQIAKGDKLNVEYPIGQPEHSQVKSGRST